MNIHLQNISHLGRQARVQLALQCAFIVSLLAAGLAVANPNGAIAGTNPEAHNAARAFWNKCQREMNFPTVDDFFRIRHFGQDARVADLLVNLIAVGEKTGTFTSPWLFEGNPNETPVLGGYTVVTDFFAKPKLLLRTTAVSTMRFDEISEVETSLDGPSVRPLAVWRRVHWAYFERSLAKLDRTPSLDMPVTFEKFEVVCDYNAIDDDS
jgi:uncharacterized protein YhfF